jgi:hypothetical protein
MNDAQRLFGELERGARVIRTMLEGMGDGEARWRPPSGGWSVLEVTCHLKDEETDDFRMRLRRTLEDPTRDWPKLDPEARVTERRYQEQSLAAELQGFLRERSASLAWLRGLAAPDWATFHTHPRFGSMAAGDLLAAWVAHDLLHVRQIARIRYEHVRSIASPYRLDYAGPAPGAPCL